MQVDLDQTPNMQKSVRLAERATKWRNAKQVCRGGKMQPKLSDLIKERDKLIKEIRTEDHPAIRQKLDKAHQKVCLEIGELLKKEKGK